MILSQKQLNVLARYFDWYCPNAYALEFASEEIRNHEIIKNS